MEDLHKKEYEMIVRIRLQADATFTRLEKYIHILLYAAIPLSFFRKCIFGGLQMI